MQDFQWNVRIEFLNIRILRSCIVLQNIRCTQGFAGLHSFVWSSLWSRTISLPKGRSVCPCKCRPAAVPLFKDRPLLNVKFCSFMLFVPPMFLQSIYEYHSTNALGGKPFMTHINSYTIRWGNFSQKHNYEYMAKWWCLLAIENYMFRPIAAIIRFSLHS